MRVRSLSGLTGSRLSQKWWWWRLSEHNVGVDVINSSNSVVSNCVRAMTSRVAAGNKSKQANKRIQIYGGNIKIASLPSNVPSTFFQCARKSIVFEWNVFMHESLIFSPMSPKTTTNSVSSDTRLMSLDLHPVSASRTKVQSPAACFPSSVYHAYDVKNHCAAVGTCCVALISCQVRGRTAAQLRGNIAL